MNHETHETHEKQETLADIVAECRQDADAMDRGWLYQPTTGYLRRLLDRIEAAAKREREMADHIIEEAAQGYPPRLDNGEVGNSAAMREALLRCDAIAQLPEVRNEQSIKDMRNIIKRALAKPPRNCDKGTAEEQAKRFQDFCDDSQVDEDYTSMCARCTLRREKHCELAWAQMPYTEGGAK